MFNRYESEQKANFAFYYLDDWLRISVKVYKHPCEWDEKAIRCFKQGEETVEKEICLAEIVPGNERIRIRVYLLLGQSVNQPLFNQRLVSERVGLLFFLTLWP